MPRVRVAAAVLHLPRPAVELEQLERGQLAGELEVICPECSRRMRWDGTTSKDGRVYDVYVCQLGHEKLVDRAS